MRKVPNVNTHIFKQPGIPWQTASFSDAALAAFAKYDTLGDGLTDAEKAAMAAYIDAEVAAGNQAKKDYEVIFGLSGNNALVDYVGGKVATNVNAATQSVNGFAFDGSTNYINSNYNPNTDKINYSLNDAQIDIFVSSFDSIAAFDYFVGGTRSAVFSLLGTAATAAVRNVGINGGASSFTKAYAANSLLSVSRQSATHIKAFTNGVQDGSDIANNSTSVLNAPIFVGAYANITTPSNYAAITVSSLMISASLADQLSHYSNLSTLLSSL